MSVNIKLKHSATKGKAPLPTDLTDGELALNVNAASPAAYLKDSAGNVVKLAGTGSVSTPDASETVKGIAEIATQAEVTTGTDDTRIVTPAKLAAGVPAATETKAGRVELATAAETTTGTDDTRAVHPAGLKVELDKRVKKAGDTMTGDLGMNDGTSDVITLDVSAGSVTATDGTESVVVKKDGTVVASGDIQSTSQNGGPLAGFRNQLINADFRIWQRGNSFANGPDQYSSDRWFIGHDNGSVIKVTGVGGSPDAPDGFFNSLQATPNAGAMWVGQPIELPGVGAPGQFAVGTTWTASFWGRALSSTSEVHLATYFASTPGGNGAVGIQSSPKFTLTTAWQKFEWTFTINVAPGSTNTLFNFNIESTTASQTCRFAGCQLEPGPVATPFEYRPIGTELALCQRFYQARSSGAVNAADLRPSMRATPTVAGNNYDAEL